MKSKRFLGLLLCAVLMFTLLPMSALAFAANENFDNFGSTSPGFANPLIVNGWQIGVFDSFTGIADANEVTVTNDNSYTPLAGAGDYAVCVSSLSYSPLYAQFKSSGSLFRLTQFKMDGESGVNYMLQGYRDGVLVTGAIYNFSAPFLTETTVNVSSVSAFQNIDEFRIYQDTYNNGMLFYLDDIIISEAAAAPSITTISLPGGTVGTVYNQILTADGDMPVAWNVDGGSLPAGLTLSSGGIISGTPVAQGTFSFTVKATNSAGNDTQALSMDVSPASPPDGVLINETNFPDNSFRSWIVSNLSGAEDNILTPAEIAAITVINVNNKNIADLTGVEHFAALQILACGGNNLTTLDVSGNTALEELHCNNNTLTQLDVSKNTGLTKLVCGNNSLTGLDVSKNTALTYLNCSENALTALDIRNNTALTDLVCAANGLIALDLSQNTALSNFQGDAQEVFLTLTGNGSIGYTVPISLNSPSFGQAAITYEIGTLKSTDHNVPATNFTVQTGNESKTFTGVMYLTYPPQYALTVINGMPTAGLFTAGTSVNIQAYSVGPGEMFDRWITNNGGVFASETSANTTFTMPENAVTVTATYKAAPPPGTAPTITTTSLPGGKVGTAYSQTLAADGDTPIAWTIESGSLPTGLILSGGIIRGTPTTVGTFLFTLKAENSEGQDTQALSIVISLPIPPPIITTNSLPNATMFMEYNQNLFAISETPVTWDMVGPFPNNGLSFYDGTISGTPLTSGTFYFTVKATNIGGYVTKDLSITILPPMPPVITTTALSDGMVGTPYSEALTADGVAPITWTIESGSLPTGLTLSSGGSISGTPSAAGAFTFTLKAENSEGFDTKELRVAIGSSGSGGNGGSGGGPAYASRTLNDAPTGVTISGSIPAGARLTVSPLSLNGTGSDAVSIRIREAIEKGQLIAGYDIRLSGGFRGEITLSFPVGTAYNGRTVTILHFINGRMETYTAVVTNGVATIAVDSLSPFLVLNTGVTVPSYEVSDPPKTGDAAAPIGFIMLALAAACTAAAVFRRRTGV